MYKSPSVQVSKIKRGTEISFPVLILLLFSPTFSPFQSFSSHHLFLFWSYFHCVTISGLEVSNFGSFHLSIPKALLVSLQHSWHWPFSTLTLWAQPRPWCPATTNHHLKAVAGGREAVVGCRCRTLQTELMQSGGEMCRQAAAVLGPTHITPLRLGGTGDKGKMRY